MDAELRNLDLYHSDIKPENIMLTSGMKPNIHLIDLDNISFKPRDNCSTTNEYTPSLII